MDSEYCASLQTSISSITGIQILMYMCIRVAKLCVKCYSCEFSIVWIMNSKSGKFLLKLRADHSGKFAPKEINPLASYTVAN